MRFSGLFLALAVAIATAKQQPNYQTSIELDRSDNNKTITLPPPPEPLDLTIFDSELDRSDNNKTITLPPPPQPLNLTSFDFELDRYDSAAAANAEKIVSALNDGLSSTIDILNTLGDKKKITKAVKKLSSLAGPLGAVVAVLSVVTAIIDLAMGPQKSAELVAVETGFEKTLAAIEKISNKIEDLSREVAFHSYNSVYAEEVDNANLAHNEYVDYKNHLKKYTVADMKGQAKKDLDTSYKKKLEKYNLDGTVKKLLHVNENVIRGKSMHELLSEMTKCDIPKLYFYLSKVLTASMRAQMANELKWKLGMFHKHKGTSAQIRAKRWHQYAANFEFSVRTTIGACMAQQVTRVNDVMKQSRKIATTSGAVTHVKDELKRLFPWTEFVILGFNDKLSNHYGPHKDIFTWYCAGKAAYFDYGDPTKGNDGIRRFIFVAPLIANRACVPEDDQKLKALWTTKYHEHNTVWHKLWKHWQAWRINTDMWSGRHVRWVDTLKKFKQDQHPYVAKFSTAYLARIVEMSPSSSTNYKMWKPRYLDKISHAATTWYMGKYAGNYFDYPDTDGKWYGLELYMVRRQWCGPQSDCATRNPCSNGGVCYQLAFMSDTICNCQPGWEGETCTVRSKGF